MNQQKFSPLNDGMEEKTECPNCGEEGITRLLLTKIPFFREVFISAFKCSHCHISDNSIQFAGEFPANGVHFALHVKNQNDLNRNVCEKLSLCCFSS
jgi:zinc finger protein